MKMNHEGMRTYRLADNPMERAYHDAWLAENTGESFRSDLLAHILGDGVTPAVVSERDALVAATIIQWLGTPVGQNFVVGVQATQQRKAT